MFNMRTLNNLKFNSPDQVNVVTREEEPCLNLSIRTTNPTVRGFNRESLHTVGK